MSSLGRYEHRESASFYTNWGRKVLTRLLTVSYYLLHLAGFHTLPGVPLHRNLELQEPLSRPVRIRHKGNPQIACLLRFHHKIVITA
jgi:hypothetical protein